MSVPSEKQPVARTSADPNAERVAQLKALFPEAFADGKFDTEKLRAALGEQVVAGPERFTFSWAGRSDAAAVLQTPSRATLLPVPEQSVNFDTTKNLFIEGDNLEVLKLLYKPYHGRVKLIYIDPPYNTGQDFIYPDDFRDTLANYLALTGQADAEGNRLTSNAETSGRYHSDWLSMMYPRLFLARQLLRDDGVIFVSIDDHEVHHLRMLMNEVFGEENFVACIIWHKMDSPKNSAIHFSEDHDYILVYARNADGWRPNPLPRTAEMIARYKNPDNDPRGVWLLSDLAARNFYSQGQYAITTPSGKTIEGPPAGSYWRVSKDKFDELDKDGRIWWGKSGDNRPGIKRFLSEVKDGVVPQTYWSWEDVGSTRNSKQELSSLLDAKSGDELFITPKPSQLLHRILQICTSPEANDIVLDFFSGTATTAHATLQLNRDDGGNRRFVMVQLQEPTEGKQYGTIAEIGKERVRRVITKLKGETGNLTRTEPEDLGFKVFRLADSHFAQWSGVDERTPDAYQKQLRLIADDPLKKGWTPSGLLWEMAVKEGYGLNSTIETVPAKGATFYKVSDPEKSPPQRFLACFDDSVPEDIAKQLSLTADDLLVVRDAALDDTLASNLALQCRLRTI